MFPLPYSTVKEYIRRAQENVIKRLKMFKHRCVNSDFFEASKVRQAYEQMLRDKGLSEEQIDLFLVSHRRYLFIRDDIRASIERNIAWAFNKSIFVPQRYNTEFFGAYYTGKEVETVEKEFEFYYRKTKNTKPVKYTVFSLEVSAQVADLRSISEIRSFIVDPVDYSVCQLFGDELRTHCEALAVPSVRHSTGNCCPIFVPSTLVPGDWVKDGELMP